MKPSPNRNFPGVRCSLAALGSPEKGFVMNLGTWLKCASDTAEMTVKAITRFAAVHVPMH
jgi:hypothetical protein